MNIFTNYTTDNFGFDPSIKDNEPVIQNLTGGQWFYVTDNEELTEEDKFIRLDDCTWRCNGVNTVSLDDGRTFFFDPHTRVQAILPTISETKPVNQYFNRL